MKPFLRWAGGKTQLLDELNRRLPLNHGQVPIIERYVEPFVGGGAFFFFLKRNYKVKEAFLIDINKDLITAYQVIKDNVDELIYELKDIEDKYLRLSSEERRSFYYRIRNEYNQKGFYKYTTPTDRIKRTAYLIFLNKTCFNGLYRLNKKGEFNVPLGRGILVGRHKSPSICDENNLIEASKALADTEIICGDFEESRKYIQKGTLVYLDPPYRPLNATSNFTGYNEDRFNDKDQIRLAKFFREMDRKGAFLMLSNSDPKNEDEKDNFFDELYSGFVIERVKARRYINCDGNKRGYLNELIIRNYFT